MSRQFIEQEVTIVHKRLIRTMAKIETWNVDIAGDWFSYFQVIGISFKFEYLCFTSKQIH